MAEATVWYLVIEIYRSMVIVPLPYPSLEQCAAAGKTTVYHNQTYNSPTTAVGVRNFICVPRPADQS